MSATQNSLYISRHFKFNSLMYIADGFTGMLWNGLTVTYLLLYTNWCWAQYKGVSVERVSSGFLGYFQALLSVGMMISLLAMIIFSEDMPVKKRAVMWFGSIKRLTVLFFALVTWLLPPGARMISVIVISLLFYLSGADGLPWRVMYAKVIPIEKRGVIEAWRNIYSRLGGFTGLALAIAIFNPARTGFVRWLMHILPGLADPDQTRYFAFFLINSIFGFVSLFFIAATREPKEECPALSWKIRLRDKLDQLRQIISQDRNFRNFQLYNIMSALSDLMMLGYAALFVRKYLGLGEAVWGELNVITMILGIGAMFRWGKQGDAYGWKKVLIKLSFYIVSVPLIFIALAYLNLQGFHHWAAGFSTIYEALIKNTRDLTMLLLCLAFALLGLYKNPAMASKTYMALEFSPDKLHTSYFGITSLVQQASTVMGGLLVGICIDKLGIPGMITSGILLQLIAAGFAYLNLQEPRLPQSRTADGHINMSTGLLRK
ncbi:MAG: hypothetical protein ACM3WV_06885 [Bacillota bacterium]